MSRIGDGEVSGRPRFPGDLVKTWPEGEPTAIATHKEALVEADYSQPNGPSYEYGPFLGRGDRPLPAGVVADSGSAVAGGGGQLAGYCAMSEVYMGAVAATNEQNDGHDYGQDDMPTNELTGVPGPLAATTGRKSQVGGPIPPSVRLPQGFAAVYWNERLVVHRPDEGTVNLTQAGQAVGMASGKIHQMLRQKPPESCHYRLKGQSNYAGTYVSYDDAREIMGGDGAQLMDWLQTGVVGPA